MTEEEARSLSKGTLVKCIKLSDRNITKDGYSDGYFTIGKIYTIGGHYFDVFDRHNSICVTEDDSGSANCWTPDHFELCIEKSLNELNSELLSKLKEKRS